MSFKPLARWTIGPVSNCGMEILRESVKVFEKIYPEFDLVVCYNNINLEVIPSFNSTVKIHKQKNGEIDYSLTAFNDPLLDVQGPLRKSGMAGSGWKLCPPRLRLEAHELWLDNDIVIRERLPEIDEWLKTDGGIISEGLHRLFGIYQNFVPKNLKICAGFFGLPPHFDFHCKILEYCKLLNGKPLGHYDEQGLVSAIVTNLSEFIVVPQKNLMILEDCNKLPTEIPLGIHFVGANRLNYHNVWSDYKQRSLKLI